MPPSPDTLPNYHFLLIAPNLGAEWFFDAARLYWERFRPTVVSDLGLISLIPERYTVAITVIARIDTASQWGVSIAQVKPDALFDPVVENAFENLKRILDARAADNQPFGVPLASTPTAPPPVNPTPGSILGPVNQPTQPPTREPGGFITATPTTDPNLPPPPTATPIPTTEGGGGPIYPTPGPITGGG
jgi:hypothetical protein